ncbi:MAG: hypothetical protein KJ915_01925 [Candidatus Omnitrophica bacterium]|nr:hypothetical protein [Candidatus Omnitrophota bacterium]
MKVILTILAAIFFCNFLLCPASAIIVKEKNDFSLKYAVDSDNLINFPLSEQPNFNKIDDNELNKLIEEAIVKQKNHPVFDPKYAINPEILKNKILRNLAEYYWFPENHIQHQKKLMKLS